AARRLVEKREARARRRERRRFRAITDRRPASAQIVVTRKPTPRDQVVNRLAATAAVPTRFALRLLARGGHDIAAMTAKKYGDRFHHRLRLQPTCQTAGPGYGVPVGHPGRSRDEMSQQSSRRGEYFSELRRTAPLYFLPSI